ncbi:MAG: DUF3299 domain-containing protein [Phycisphaerales bacterium]|nr:DUF3299 domain-containing protein [Phycisphaerales bacterium]
MRSFWLIIAALFIVTGVVVAIEVRPGRGEGPPPGSPGTAGDQPAPTPLPVPPEVRPPSTPTPPPQTPPAPPAEAAAPPPKPAAEPSGLDVDALIADLKRDIAASERPPAQPEPAPAAPSAGAPPAEPDRSAAPETAAPQPTAAGALPGLKLDRQADGHTLVDDRFLIRGDGSKENPYVVAWDILVSASETYRPRLGKKDIPERIAMLSGKRVRITGYVLFPMFQQEASELLMMRNQWDGCCIGVPPTPYDAVEIKLAASASRDAMMLQFGTVEGDFKVDPYLNKDWLLGLYVMENAVLSKVQEGREPPRIDPGQHNGM